MRVVALFLLFLLGCADHGGEFDIEAAKARRARCERTPGCEWLGDRDPGEPYYVWPDGSRHDGPPPGEEACESSKLEQEKAACDRAPDCVWIGPLWIPRGRLSEELENSTGVLEL